MMTSQQDKTLPVGGAMCLGCFLIAVCATLIGADEVITGVTTDSDDDGAFYFGTQTMLCLASGSGIGLPRISRRSIFSDDDADGPTPRRSDSRYIHRLFRYRGRVFEWGGGTRGYHVGPAASVVDCPVTWESTPAGYSRCPVERLVEWTTRYRRRYGGYNLFANNCHHFANRAAAFIVDGEACHASSSTTTPAARNGDDVGGPSRRMKVAWRVLSWIVSMVSDGDDTER